MKYLIEKGDNVNAQTYLGRQTPMNVLRYYLKYKSPPGPGSEIKAEEIRKLLKAAGAEDANGEI